MKVLFSGYRNVGYKCLKFLISQKADIVGVLTEDDTLDEKRISNNSVKELAEKNGLKVFITTKDNKDKITDEIISLKSDVHLSAFYSKIIDKRIIENIPINTNLHGGKLPDYKGCYSNIWSIINGEKTTAVTLQLMKPEIDAGEIISEIKIPITKEDTGGSLYHRIENIAIELFEYVYYKLNCNNEFTTIKQTGKGTYYKRGLPNNGELDLNWDEEMQYDFIRALDFPPLEPAHIIINNKKIYLYKNKMGEL